MKNKHKFFLVWLLHVLLSIVTFLGAFITGMARFDGEGNLLLEQVLSLISNVLSFPLVLFIFEYTLVSWFPGLLWYISIFLNSALWAALIVYGLTKYRQSASRAST